MIWGHQVRRCSISLLIVAAVLVPTAGAQPPAVDRERLVTLLRARSFHAPEGFKALVVELERSSDGTTVAHYYDWQGTSDDREDWWPASTVKIFAAVAALERMNELGFPVRSWLTYQYVEESQPAPVTMRMDQIVRLAIGRSSNPDFDRLVELVGFDEINRDFLVPRNGIHDTVFLRGYGGRHRDETTGVSTARHSPTITLRQGRRVQTLEARHGTGTYDCPDEGNCTTLLDLTETMRRVMLHEELPVAERYRLREPDLAVLRDALAVARNRHIAEVFEEAFGDAPVRVWHKPGYALQWVSDVLFIHRTDTGQRWVVAMAARRDRRALDSAAAHVGALLASGGLGAQRDRAAP